MLQRIRIAADLANSGTYTGTAETVNIISISGTGKFYGRVSPTAGKRDMSAEEVAGLISKWEKIQMATGMAFVRWLEQAIEQATAAAA